MLRSSGMMARSLGMFHVEELSDVCRFSAIVRVVKRWRISRTANVMFVGEIFGKRSLGRLTRHQDIIRTC